MIPEIKKNNDNNNNDNNNSNENNRNNKTTTILDMDMEQTWIVHKRHRERGRNKSDKSIYNHSSSKCIEGCKRNLECEENSNNFLRIHMIHLQLTHFSKKYIYLQFMKCKMQSSKKIRTFKLTLI